MKHQRSYARWLSQQEGIPKYAAAARYFKKLHQAFPLWADEKAIKAVYDKARRRRAKGEDVHVDHTVPLTHPYVCGLHVAANLQIVDAKVNLCKSNNYWPNCWNECFEMEFPEEPYQLTLL